MSLIFVETTMYFPDAVAKARQVTDPRLLLANSSSNEFPILEQDTQKGSSCLKPLYIRRTRRYLSTVYVSTTLIPCTYRKIEVFY